MSRLDAIKAACLRPRRGRVVALWSLLAVVLGVAAMFVLVFPARAYLAKRGEETKARAELSLIESQNRQLEAEKHRLQSDAEIERLARERFNLVKPGEQAYAIVPEATTTTTAPPPPPAPPATPSSAP